MGFITQTRADEIIKTRGSFNPNTSPQTQTTQTGGLSADTLKKAALLDIQSTGGKNLATLTALQSFFPETKTTEAEKSSLLKAKTEVQDTTRNIDEVLGKHLDLVSGAGKPIGYIPGTSAYTTRKKIEQIKNQLSLASVGKLKGQGAVSDAEREMLASAASAIDLGMSENDLRVELVKVKDILNRNIEEKSSATPQPVSALTGILQGKTIPVVGGAIGGIAGGLLGGVPGIGGAAAGYAGGDVIRKLLAKQVGVQAEPANQLQSIGETALGAGGAALTEVAGLGLGKLIGKGASLLKAKPAQYTPEMLKTGLQTAEKGSTLRNTAIQLATKENKKIEGNKLTTAISEWATRAKRANPNQAETIKGFVQGATKSFKGKNITTKTAFNLWEDADRGHSAAGKVGNSLEAEYHRVIRDVLRKQLDKVAPGFEKGTGLIKEGLTQEKLLKTIRTSLERDAIKEGLKETPSPILKVLKGAGKTAGYGLGGMALYKLLGMKQPIQ
jgi:hypothetical protein